MIGYVILWEGRGSQGNEELKFITHLANSLLVQVTLSSLAVVVDAGVVITARHV